MALGKAVKIDGTDRGPIEVRLEPTASATGRLLDGAGRPCDGVEVRAWRVVNEPTRGSQQEFSPPIQATTDADGRFRIVGIVPGVAQKLWVKGLGASPPAFILEGWTPKPGEVKDIGEIRPGGVE